VLATTSWRAKSYANCILYFPYWFDCILARGTELYQHVLESVGLPHSSLEMHPRYGRLPDFFTSSAVLPFVKDFLIWPLVLVEAERPRGRGGVNVSFS
jgi:hypothetical protein